MWLRIHKASTFYSRVLFDSKCPQIKHTTLTLIKILIFVNLYFCQGLLIISLDEKENRRIFCVSLCSHFCRTLAPSTST